MKVLTRILRTFYRQSDNQKETTENKCWVNKGKKAGKIINRNRVSDVKVFTKRRDVREIPESQEIANKIKILKKMIIKI